MDKEAEWVRPDDRFRNADVPFWLDNEFPSINYSDLPSAARVLIIGAGMSGVSLAYWLRKSGVEDIVVVEQREGLSRGATGRNGGHLWPSMKRLPDEMLRTYGEDEEMKVFKFRLRNYELTKAFIREHEVACDFSERGAITVARSQIEATELQEYMLLMQKHGFDLGMEWWNAEKVKEEIHGAFAGGLYQSVAARFWPAKLVYALAHECTKLGGVTFCVNTSVSATREKIDATGWEVDATHGKCTSEVLVHATNAWAEHLLPPAYRGVIRPTRGQIILSSPLPFNIPYNFSANDGYEYMIQRDDRRLVLGGCRWVSKTKEVDTYDDAQCNVDIGEALRDFLIFNFPLKIEGWEDEGSSSSWKEDEKTLIKIEREWTGIMGYSRDGLPLVGPLSEIREKRNGVRGGEYILAGYTGNGMAHCFAAGKAIAGMIVGDAEEEAMLPKIFSPRRFLVHPKLHFEGEPAEE